MIKPACGGIATAEMPAFLRSDAAISKLSTLGRSRTVAFAGEPELNAAQAPNTLSIWKLPTAWALPHNRLDFEALVFAHGSVPEKVGLQPWRRSKSGSG